MSRLLSDLSPRCLDLFNKFKVVLDQADIKFVVVFTKRTVAEQIALFAQGRQAYDAVNQLRGEAGLPPLQHPQENVIITQVDGIHKISHHQTGDAFDLTFADGNGDPYYPNDPVRWFALGNMAESVGLDWGGRFQPLDKNGLGWDPDHFEVNV